jgi:hypothetical protein
MLNGPFGTISKLTGQEMVVNKASLIIEKIRFVPNLPASDYESNLQEISTVKTVQVSLAVTKQQHNLPLFLLKNINIYCLEILVCI